MTTRRPLVAANWKMNGTLESIRALLGSLRAGLDGGNGADVALCAPFPYLAELDGSLSGSGIAIGAQNLSEHVSGAFTGEVSAEMLRDYNCRFVIVGHSERRTLYGENDELVARKYLRALDAGLTPILCVGELLEEREARQTEEVVARQLDRVIGAAGAESFRKAVIAYEPVWAIGTGRTATPEQAQEVHAFIRLRLARHDDAAADAIRILYGGSVNAANAKSLFTMADVDGGLVGGASLKAAEFLEICRAAR
jgi:triosephosphate isomerase